MKTANRLPGADSLRGLASLGVLLYHAIWVGGLKVTPEMGLVANNFGLGVPLFFIISGLVMYQTYYGKSGEPGFVGSFLVKRYARLLPLILVILLLTNLHTGLFKSAGFGLTFFEVLLGVTLLFGFFPLHNGGPVMAAWSIGVEMVFYFFFPLMMRWLRRADALFLGLVLTLALSFFFQLGFKQIVPATSHYYATNVFLFLPCFFYGGLIYLLPHYESRSGLGRLLLLGVCFLVLFGAGYFYQLNPYRIAGASGVAEMVYWYKVQLFSLAFAVILYIQAYSPSSIVTNRFTLYLGRLSYGIYLVHPPVIIYLKIYLLPWLNQQLNSDPNLVFLSFGAVVALVTVGLAELLYRLVEHPGMRLGGVLAARWQSGAKRKLKLVG
jgi:peptidoglycan/LPS O-acetylase OafA/YrhL